MKTGETMRYLTFMLFAAALWLISASPAGAENWVAVEVPAGKADTSYSYDLHSVQHPQEKIFLRFFKLKDKNIVRLQAKETPKSSTYITSLAGREEIAYIQSLIEMHCKERTFIRVAEEVYGKATGEVAIVARKSYTAEEIQKGSFVDALSGLVCP